MAAPGHADTASEVRSGHQQRRMANFRIGTPGTVGRQPLAARRAIGDEEVEMSVIAMPEPDASVMSRRNHIVRDLQGLVGAAAVIADEDGRRAFETDGLSAYRCMPLAVVLPRSTEDVAKVLEYAHENGIAVIPRGAGTSLCGGALPAEDAIVIGVSRMNRVLDIDLENR